MSLRIEERDVQGVRIMSLHGRLVLGDESRTLQSALDHFSDQKTGLIIDLADVSFIDSTGLGLLVGAYTRAAKAGGTIRLLHASKKHIELLVLTKLTTIFQLFDDEHEAVDSFFPDRERKPFDILEFVKREGSDEPVS
jgi:anti-sigma B factor antagonist